MDKNLFDIFEKSFVSILNFLLKFICENILKHEKNKNEINIEITIKISFNIKR